jgi:hypothetical protein
VRTDTGRFRFYSKCPSHEQRWTRLPRRFRFVDETAGLMDLYRVVAGRQSELVLSPRSPRYAFKTPDSLRSDLFSVRAASSPLESPPVISPAPSYRDASVPATTGSPPILMSNCRTIATLPGSFTVDLTCISSPRHDIAFPLQRPHESRLMQYYLNYMCKWVS